MWFVVTIAFISLKLFVPNGVGEWKYWLLFIYAIPTSAIVWTIYNDIFFKRFLNIFSVSILCWTLALSIYLSFLKYENISGLFIAVIPFQILIVLFHLLLLKKKKKEK